MEEGTYELEIWADVVIKRRVKVHFVNPQGYVILTKAQLDNILSRELLPEFIKHGEPVYKINVEDFAYRKL